MFSARGLTLPAGWLPALKARNLPMPNRFKMHSAMTERAEFPVQRKSTLRGSGRFTTCMASSSMLRATFRCRGLRATFGERGFDQLVADIRLGAAAILDQEGEQRAGAGHVHRIDDRAALFARSDERCAGENGEVRRERVGRHAKRPRDVARRHARRALTNEQAEDLESAFLRKRGKRLYGLMCFHISRSIEMCWSRQALGSQRERLALRPWQ